MNGSIVVSFIGRQCCGRRGRERLGRERLGRVLLAAMVLLSCVVAASSAGATTLFVSDGVDDVVHRFDATTGAAIAPSIPLQGVFGVATGPNGDLYAVSN